MKVLSPIDMLVLFIRIIIHDRLLKADFRILIKFYSSSSCFNENRVNL
jgi:hypothetical protein